MKKVIVYPLLIAFAIAVSFPVKSIAQNDKPGKKEKTESVAKTKKVVTPPPPAVPDPPVPPGQVGKTDPNEKEQGYEKTGDKGRKEGWDKEKTSVDNKAAQKELKKVERKRNKELRKAEKKRLKEERKASRNKQSR